MISHDSIKYQFIYPENSNPDELLAVILSEFDFKPFAKKYKIAISEFPSDKYSNWIFKPIMINGIEQYYTILPDE